MKCGSLVQNPPPSVCVFLVTGKSIVAAAPITISAHMFSRVVSTLFAILCSIELQFDITATSIVAYLHLESQPYCFIFRNRKFLQAISPPLLYTTTHKKKGVFVIKWNFE